MGYLGVALVVLGALIVVTWRLASRRHELPCPVWLRWMVELDNPLTRVNRAATIVEVLAVEPGMQVLDLGCGPGRLALPLARAVGPKGHVTAVDVQQGMLDRARQKVQREGLDNVTFRRAGAGDGVLGEGVYDRAVLVTVLGEIPDRQAALDAVYAALKSGGVLAVTEVIFDPHFQRYSLVKQLAANAGFDPGAFHGHRLAYTALFEKRRQD